MPSYFRLEDALPNPGPTGDASVAGLLPLTPSPPVPPTQPPPYDWSAILDALGGPVGPAGVTPDWAAMVRAFDPARWSSPPSALARQGDVAVASGADAGATPPSPSVPMASPSDVDRSDPDDPDQEAAPASQFAANVAAKSHAAVSTTPKALPPEQQARNVAAAREALGHPEVRAFLNALATGESGDRDNVLNGGRHFSGSQYPTWAKRPAGAYQIKPGTYEDNQRELGLPDFRHDSQEVMAAHIMRKAGAIEPLLNGDLKGAIDNLNNIWTSLPGTNERNVHTDSFKDRYAATLGLLRAQQVPYP